MELLEKVQPKIFSDDASKLIKSSYLGNNNAQKLVGKKYRLDNDLSNREQKVYLDRQNRPKVVFTGTRKFQDVLDDGLLAVGLEGLSHRFRQSKRLIDKVEKKYPNKKITTLGHSLGGSLAEYAGGDKVITFDKGVGIGTVGKTIKNNQTDVRTNTDPVSFLKFTQKGGKSINIPNTTYINPLYAHDTKHLDKLNKYL